MNTKEILKAHKITEVTQALIDDLKISLPDMTEQEIYDDLTMGKTFARDRNPASSMGPERLTIQHRFGRDRYIDVRVEGPNKGTFTNEPSGSINWPGWGSQDPETTKVFVNMLSLAAELAPTLSPKITK